MVSGRSVVCEWTDWLIAVEVWGWFNERYDVRTLCTVHTVHALRTLRTVHTVHTVHSVYTLPNVHTVNVVHVALSACSAGPPLSQKRREAKPYRGECAM